MGRRKGPTKILATICDLERKLPLVYQFLCFLNGKDLITVINTLSHALQFDSLFFSCDRERESCLVLCQSLIEDLTGIRV